MASGGHEKPVYRLPIPIEECRLSGSSQFRDIVSGRRHGVGPSVLRGVLRVGECFYSAAVQWRNRRYDRGKAAVHRVGVPVVSVGNLTLGGTGKTPMVAWIARWFVQRGVRVAVVSRGYGAKAGQANDEALELAKMLPHVPHLQNPDRVAAARDAIERFQSQAIVLDDGFQHRRIGRDLNIVLLDALEPFGFGHVFPRGTLREPIEELRRADVVVLSRADHLDAVHRESLWKLIKINAPQADFAEAIHAPQRFFSAEGVAISLESMQGRPVAAFCGIGNPKGFRHTLAGCGCRVVGFREYADHHRYTSDDCDALTSWAAGLGASAIVCTGKDLVKLPTERLGSMPLWAIGIELKFLAGQETLESRLLALAP
jgi:tetraacyldisaccharide 4'-kinase